MEGLAHIARPVPQGEALDRVSLILGLARQVTLASAASMHKARRGEVMSRAGVGRVSIAASLLEPHVAETNGDIVTKVRSVKLGNYRDLLFLAKYWAEQSNGCCSGRTVEEDCRTVRVSHEVAMCQ